MTLFKVKYLRYIIPNHFKEENILSNQIKLRVNIGDPTVERIKSWNSK